MDTVYCFVNLARVALDNASEYPPVAKRFEEEAAAIYRAAQHVAWTKYGVKMQDFEEWRHVAKEAA